VEIVEWQEKKPQADGRSPDKRSRDSKGVLFHQLKKWSVIPEQVKIERLSTAVNSAPHDLGQPWKGDIYGAGEVSILSYVDVVIF
jgi:hypothetical protein